MMQTAPASHLGRIRLIRRLAEQLRWCLQSGGDWSELKVNKRAAAAVLDHHFWIECSQVLVPGWSKTAPGRFIAMGISHTLLEEMPLSQRRPRGRRDWNWHTGLPRAEGRGGCELAGDHSAAVAVDPARASPN